MKKNIREILRDRVLVLDGAMGTMIQTYGLTEADFRGGRFADHPCNLKGNNDILVLSRPDVLQAIHTAYLEAGAHIVTTCTFNANRVSQTEYHTGDLCYEINRTAAGLARACARKFDTDAMPRFVAGSVGPTGKSLSLSPDVDRPDFRSISFEELKAAYKEQISGLVDGGVDLLLFETFFDTLNLKAALAATADIYAGHGAEWRADDFAKHGLPELMVSATVSDTSGRILSGQSLTAMVYALSSYPLLSVGLNCALGAEDIRQHIRTLQQAPFFVSAHPNAGLPDQNGQYDGTPEKMAVPVGDFLRMRWLNIVGGCCGTTPEHIRRFAALAAEAAPHVPTARTGHLLISGLDSVRIGKDMNFTHIGERCNVAGSKRFARLIREGAYEEAVSVARTQVSAGAQVLDVNMDDPLIQADKAMTTFLSWIAADPDIAKVPVMIDSSRFDVIMAGLQCIQGKAIVNSISLKEGADVFKAHAAALLRFGAAVVVMAFDESGQATTYERRIAICRRAYRILTEEVGFAPSDIIFDPNILSIATGMQEHARYAVDFIEAVRWIKANLPEAKVSGGVSNLSFAFRGHNGVREAMHSVFLYHAIQAGMDMGIVNAGMLRVYDEIPQEQLTLVEDVVLDRRADATERLIAALGSFDETTQAEQQPAGQPWREKPVADRIVQAVVKGITEYFQEDMTEALETFPTALAIIEGPLMQGMDKVGGMFSSGKMFLPQVIKSARVMKQAVTVLQPRIEAENAAAGVRRKGRILLATVKGDVHDIGKNIVGIVLSCNNYEVIDLGVMVPAEQIVETAMREKVDAIGLSGLITPSLDEMATVIRTLEARGADIPVLIGGATTSPLHTALKLACLYKAPVIHVRDAASDVSVMQSLRAEEQGLYIAGIRQEQARMVARYEQEHKTYCTPGEAFANRFKADFTHYTPTPPAQPGLTIFKDYDLQTVLPYINWTYFFKAWGIPGHYPGIFGDPRKGSEARKLFDDATQLLQRVLDEKRIAGRAALGLFPALSKGNCIEVYPEGLNASPVILFPKRNLEKQADGKPNLSLADFIASEEVGKNDYIGLFALTAGIGLQEEVERLRRANDDYSALLLQTLADRLAEALAEKLHQDTRRIYWGYAPDERWSPDELRTVTVQGIRPAVGYSAYSDHSEKRKLFRVLHAGELGMSLTGNYSMLPAASICGLMMAHPESRYFMVFEPMRDTSTSM
ncbi:MAG: methionine synthase [Bacteroidales bacterium]|nr:methionine synthase [Bacteroidales bacterium]